MVRILYYINFFIKKTTLFAGARTLHIILKCDVCLIELLIEKYIQSTAYGCHFSCKIWTLVAEGTLDAKPPGGSITLYNYPHQNQQQ